MNGAKLLRCTARCSTRAARLGTGVLGVFNTETVVGRAMPVADNVLERRFEPGAIDRVWVADMTYVPTSEGWLYLGVVLDLGSRMIVGWSMGETMTSRLVVDAMRMALSRRHPKPGLLTHTDRGSQYASGAFRDVLKEYGITSSMCQRGNCRAMHAAKRCSAR